MPKATLWWTIRSWGSKVVGKRTLCTLTPLVAGYVPVATLGCCSIYFNHYSGYLRMMTPQSGFLIIFRGLAEAPSEA